MPVSINQALLARRAALPDRQDDRELHFLWHELWWCYWNVLAFEHDGMEAEAEAARRNAADCARLLREYSDPLDDEEASEVRVAWAVEMGRWYMRRWLEHEREELAQPGADREAVLAEGWRATRGKSRIHRTTQEHTSRSPIG